MDFALNDIQQMLQDSAAKFIQNDYDFETRRRLSESELGYSEENWKLFAELGWLALPFDEEYGGLGGNLTDLMVLQIELGRGLVVEPFFSSVVLGGNLIQRHGSASQRAELLEPLIAGELKLAFAYIEPQSHTSITDIETSAERSEAGYRLTGHKAVVLGGPSADLLLVAARTSGKRGDRNGLSLFLVDPAQPGVTLKSYPTNDGFRAADIHFDDAKASLLGEVDSAHGAIQATLDDAIVALSAEAVGVMEKLLDATVEFCKVRKQFGQPIGKFQVLQHRMADMFMECEQTRSMLYFGAITATAGGEEASRAASMLKVKVGSAGRLVGQQAVQLHGGMGVSDELDVGHFFKRITMINTLLGSRDEHLQRLIGDAQVA
ncbi:pimeloyl-CoA dehydrogenase small subunit [Halomonas eurihalina]|uniref:Pimeloyl-CoA dehydrogenase small subunit n=1 Tax=Halomonas eurihalina TaxID=42566 RepID=A0A5D9CKP4_HALER|nr:acyl-CoA dehydrogenase [Halomonas eurihalina]MDR5861225.1 acyl-CoA dehydrogenase [Halomonas eurihalina]TZG32598.1 pimeloyl-CoA dehydrogenase small subunit [Halomonas eurihalina]